MTDELTTRSPDSQRATLHPIASVLADALQLEADDRIQVVRDDEQRSLAIEETTSTIAFAEAEGQELRIVPFDGDAESLQDRPYVVRVGPSWLDDGRELVVSLPALTDPVHQTEVLGFLRAALDYWVRSAEPTPSVPQAPVVVPEPERQIPHDATDVDVSELIADDIESDAQTEVEGPTAIAQMRADVSEQWSWASSAARIPQISDLMVALSGPIEHARISVGVRDADLQFGFKVAFEGPLPSGTTAIGSVHVPLSARVMSQIEERQGAECAITLEDIATERVLARVDEAIDVQPRDLWFWNGDPHRSSQRKRRIQRHNELVDLLQANAEREDADEIVAEIHELKALLAGDRVNPFALARSLLASFVRPNHPEIAVLAREAADALGRATKDPSFLAFQIDDTKDAAEKVEAEVTAIYDSLRARRIAYSNPPPGWDYTQDGQRIRDHGDVARVGWEPAWTRPCLPPRSLSTSV